MLYDGISIELFSFTHAAKKSKVFLFDLFKILINKCRINKSIIAHNESVGGTDAMKAQVEGLELMVDIFIE